MFLGTLHMFGLRRGRPGKRAIVVGFVVLGTVNGVGIYFDD